MPRIAYPISTERLLLRPFTPDDVDDVFAYQSREDVCRYIPYPPRTREQVAERIAPLYARSTIGDPGQGVLLPVQLRSAGRVIGDVMLHWISREHGTGEIGYVFNPDYAGHGYATEAARALLRLGFADLGLRRIVARTDARNTASAAVLRRVGMRQEAHLVENEWFKGGWSDELDFAILAREWMSRRTDDAVTPPN
jgi:RimJ/RimL family protein N-acetyltransferase